MDIMRAMAKSNQNQIDPSFKAFNYTSWAEAALAESAQLGASYSDFRFERLQSQSLSLHNGQVEGLINDEGVGLAVRVIKDGAWGFASSVDLTPEGAARTAEAAVEVAKAMARLNADEVELAPEPTYEDEYVSDYEINPFDIGDKAKVDHFKMLTQTLNDSGKVTHTDADYSQVLENKFFASSEGSRIVQQRVRLQGSLSATKIDSKNGGFQTMRTLAGPVGKGWEYIQNEYDFAKESQEIPTLLEQKISSKSVKPGKYDLVIDPTNLWLTIHESIGHATELDRVLGYEANYAGTSFATLDKLNKLQYGSKVMNVTGDRVAKYGLSTVGYDDEGVKAQSWDLIKDGRLVGYQLNRQMAQRQGFGRSNGCGFADSPGHLPLQRMPNVSLQPGKENLSTNDLISRVDRGIYIVGDGSWSIDMQRYNFQFTGQRFYEIKNGKIVGQLKDLAYQSNTIEFWNSMEAVGGAETYVLGGAFTCGKGQPSQIAPVSHGCPSALFRGVNVINTASEGVN